MEELPVHQNPKHFCFGCLIVSSSSLQLSYRRSHSNPETVVHSSPSLFQDWAVSSSSKLQSLSLPHPTKQTNPSFLYETLASRSYICLGLQAASRHLLFPPPGKPFQAASTSHLPSGLLHMHPCLLCCRLVATYSTFFSPRGASAKTRPRLRTGTGSRGVKAEGERQHSKQANRGGTPHGLGLAGAKNWVGAALAAADIQNCRCIRGVCVCGMLAGQGARWRTKAEALRAVAGCG